MAYKCGGCLKRCRVTMAGHGIPKEGCPINTAGKEYPSVRRGE